MSDQTIDLLEEECIEFFQKADGGGGHQHGHPGKVKAAAVPTVSEMPKAKDIRIPKKKFRKWWSEGKIADSERIKFYVMGKILKFVKENKDNP